jgi:hypothetical protein
VGEQKNHEAEGTSFSMPGKTHKVPKCVRDIDYIDKCVTRHTVRKFYMQETML